MLARAATRQTLTQQYQVHDVAVFKAQIREHAREADEELRGTFSQKSAF